MTAGKYRIDGCVIALAMLMATPICCILAGLASYIVQVHP